MPITAQPDPANPGKFIWVDSATGQPATQPGGTGTAYVAPSDQPAGVNIDPNAGANRTPVPTAPVLGQPGQGGGYSVDQILAGSDQELNQANQDVARIWDQVRPLQQQITTLQASTNPLDQQKLSAATSQLTSLYTTLSQSMQRVETANASRAQTLQKAIDSNQLTPSQVELAHAQVSKAGADADLAKSQGQVLVEGAPGQRDLVAAQAGLNAAQAAAQKASADAVIAKTPAEKAQLEAQAAALNAQANQTNALLPGLVSKQTAETGLTTAQTGLTGAQSDLARAQATQATANASLTNAQAAQTTATTGTLLPAQTQLAGAQATGQLAGAAGQLATIQQNLLGPGMYGLQDRVSAIRAIQDQVFGPGGTGDPAHANDLLQQYVTAQIAGGTPYEANVAAANAGLTAFGTQASMYNAAQAAGANRGTAFTGLGGNVLSTLAGMNANAPAGSTAMAGAFQDVMNQMQQRLQAPQFNAPAQGQVGGLAQPQAPQLPALLQQLAPLPGAPGAPGPSPLPQGPAGAQPMPNVGPAQPMQPMPNAAGAPAPVPSANPMSNAGPFASGGAGPVAAPFGPGAQGPAATGAFGNAAPQTSAPVTINIGGGGQTQSSYPPNQGAFSGAMPSMLQHYAPPTPDFIHQLWGDELSSGAVRSPYAAMGASA